MRKKNEPEWWAGARLLRKSGVGITDIARLFGVGRNAVHRAVDPKAKARLDATYNRWRQAHLEEQRARDRARGKARAKRNEVSPE